MGLFSRGYEATRAERKRQEEEAKKRGNKLFRFFITAGKHGKDNEADVRFLTEQPVSFFEHMVKEGNKFNPYTCSGEGCPLCAEGNSPIMKGAYLIIDKRDYSYTDKNGKKQEGNRQLRMFVQGMRVVSQLDRASSKYGITKHDVTVVRMGSGTQTTYAIERGDRTQVTEEEVRELMPEKMSESWDGTQNGLMDIIEEQLKLSFKNPDDFSDEEIEDDADGREDIISVDEDEEKPKVSKLKFGKNKSTFKTKKNEIGIDDNELPFN